MKRIFLIGRIIFKVLPIFLIVLFCNINTIFAKEIPLSGFVIVNENILVPKSVDFINTLSQELKDKSGVSIYFATLFSINEDRDSFRNNIAKDLKAPYVVIYLIQKDKKIGMIGSEDAKAMFDWENVYSEYIVPLIPKNDEEITPQTLSAMLLNGYVEMADLIAQKNGVKLEHNFPKDEQGGRMFVKAMMYIMLASMFLLLFINYVFRKRKR